MKIYSDTKFFTVPIVLSIVMWNTIQSLTS